MSFNLEKDFSILSILNNLFTFRFINLILESFVLIIAKFLSKNSIPVTFLPLVNFPLLFLQSIELTGFNFSYDESNIITVPLTRPTTNLVPQEEYRRALIYVSVCYQSTTLLCFRFHTLINLSKHPVATKLSVCKIIKNKLTYIHFELTRTNDIRMLEHLQLLFHLNII